MEIRFKSKKEIEKLLKEKIRNFHYYIFGNEPQIITNDSILNFFQLASYDEEKKRYVVYPTNLYFSLNAFSLIRDVGRKTKINLYFFTDFPYAVHFENLGVEDLIVGIASHEVRHFVQDVFKIKLLDSNSLIKEIKIEKFGGLLKLEDINDEELDASMVEILCVYYSSKRSSDYEIAEIIKSDAEEIKRKFSTYLRG
ncbi:MAG: hypothetical protein ACP5HJ_03940 [Candidatus Micrarchaeia archaeon]